jgi:hypothetical protein
LCDRSHDPPAKNAHPNSSIGGRFQAFLAVTALQYWRLRFINTLNEKQNNRFRALLKLCATAQIAPHFTSKSAKSYRLSASVMALSGLTASRFSLLWDTESLIAKTGAKNDQSGAA